MIRHIKLIMIIDYTKHIICILAMDNEWSNYTDNKLIFKYQVIQIKLSYIFFTINTETP